MESMKTVKYEWKFRAGLATLFSYWFLPFSKETKSINKQLKTQNIYKTLTITFTFM
jgi:hypothetical protein